MTTLHIVGFILTEWLLAVAEFTADWQYYAWAFLVVTLWSEAVHNRMPKLIPNRAMRILVFSAILFLLFMVNKSLIFLYSVDIPAS